MGINTSVLKKLQEEFKDFQNSHFPKRSHRFFALELCGEVGELANLEKKEWRKEDTPSVLEIDKSLFAEEAADILIALMNYCNEKEIDLGTHVEKKIALIETRRSKGLM